MMTFIKAIIATMLFVCMAVAQVQVKVVPKPNPAVDPDIIIYNSYFDRENNTWGWIYDPSVTGTTPYRDLGQTFTAPYDFYLDKIYVALSPASEQPYLDACEKAPIHVDILEFNSNLSMEPPIDTLSSQAGHMPAVMTYGVSEFLEFDINNVLLKAGKLYGFLFKFDSLKTKRYLKLVKSEDGDFYTGGRLLYTEFNGTDGRQNITVYKWKHGGGNANRDLHFWLKKGMSSAVSSSMQQLPVTIMLLPNYPNPFNTSTRLDFSLDIDAHVLLEIYDLKGERIALVVNQMMPAGMHPLYWDGSHDDGTAAPSGIYYVCLRCKDRQIRQKITLVR